MKQNYPFFYFYDLEFNPKPILEFIQSIPDKEWIGPHIGNYDKTVKIESHPADDKLWTAHHRYSNFMKCNEIANIRNYFREETGNNLINAGMLIKKSKKGYKAPFHPLMQNIEFDKKNNVTRTFDVIVPIQGGFLESPLEAFNTETEEHFVLEPKGIPFMVPTNPTWHYSWKETIYDYRLTLHLRGVQPVSYNYVKARFKQ